MRLWHYELIPVLPDKMLVAEWRECITIKRQWEKGTLKHRLVSYVMDHSKQIFIEYVWLVQKQLVTRHINYKHKYYDEIYNFCKEDVDIIHIYPDIAKYPEHNDRYLRQCYFNLQEKYDRGIITEEEWDKIYNNFGGDINE